jgi:DNA-binding MarR family transcriptional regulator
MSRRNAKIGAPPDLIGSEAQTVTLPALLAGGSDSEFRELIAELYSFVGRLQGIRRELAAALDVSVVEFGVLMGIRHLARRGRVRVKDIADHLHVSPPNVTSAINTLEAGGWLRKDSDPDDQRAVSIELTSRAKRALHTFASACCDLNDVWFKDVNREQMLTVLGFLQQLNSAYPEASFVARSLGKRRVGAASG